MTHQSRMKIVQPELIAPGTPAEQLPQRLVRKCCPHKRCGNTELRLSFETVLIDGVLVTSAGYRRTSNDDWYFHPRTDIGSLIAEANDPRSWPDADDEITPPI